MKKIVFAVIAIFFLLSAAISLAETVKLVWDANVETDLAGYKVYSSRVDGGPYALVRDVGNVLGLEINLSGETDGPIYYVATAYDQRGNESGYSNQASHVIDNTAPQPPGGCRILLTW